MQLQREEIEKEGLGNLVPNRRPTRGCRPTKGPETLPGAPGEEEDLDWEQELEIGARKDGDQSKTAVDKLENWDFPEQTL